MSQHTLPVIHSFLDNHSNDDSDYLELDKYDIDRDKRIFLNKIKKISGENIENMAKELNLNIEVNNANKNNKCKF